MKDQHEEGITVVEVVAQGREAVFKVIAEAVDDVVLRVVHVVLQGGDVGLECRHVRLDGVDGRARLLVDVEPVEPADNLAKQIARERVGHLDQPLTRLLPQRRRLSWRGRCTGLQGARLPVQPGGVVALGRGHGRHRLLDLHPAANRQHAGRKQPAIAAAHRAVLAPQ